MPEKQRHPLDIRSSPKRPTVRSGSMRKLAKDGLTLTASEQRKKNRLMRQFSARNKGYAVGISEEYRSNYDAIFRHPEDCECGSCGDDWKNKPLFPGEGQKK